MSPLHDPGVSLEISKVSFDEDPHLSFGTMQLTLAARFRLAENMFFLFELPYVHTGRDVVYVPYYGIHSESSSTLGNPYLGVETSRPDGGPVFKFGMRVPLTSQTEYTAWSYGVAAARDRWEAFGPKLTIIQVGGGLQISRTNQYRLRLLLLPTLMVPNSGDPELFLDMNTEFWITSRHVRAGIGLYDRYFVTESEHSFDARNELQTGLSFNAAIGTFHPGIHFRIPLDQNVKNVIDFTYGLNLTVDLSQGGPKDEF
jgi:hypothetical protein